MFQFLFFLLEALKLPVEVVNVGNIVNIITKRPIRPSEAEIEENAPSRSAKYRVAEKINEEEL